MEIEASNSDSLTSFNSFTKNLFSTKFDNNKKMEIKNTFRDNLENIFDNIICLDPIDENRKFGIDTKKVSIEAIINVVDDGIPLEYKGKGMENLIKTEVAISKKKTIDSISIEEPENHLSYSNMKKMIEIITKRENVQTIITTHNDMIASSLDLRNIMLIEDEYTKFLGDLDDNVAGFFVKNDTNNLLHFILSKKVILVEGPTEFLLIPKLYKQYTSSSIEKDEISVISCNGVTYKNYIEIAKLLNKKVAVITDNDKDKDKINKTINENNSNENIKIYMDNNTDNWTWEVCIYNKNSKLCDNLFPTNPKYKYLINGIEPLNRTLGWMINNKTECAYKLLNPKKQSDESEKDNDDILIEIPEYVQEAIKWISSKN